MLQRFAQRRLCKPWPYTARNSLCYPCHQRGLRPCTLDNAETTPQVPLYSILYSDLWFFKFTQGHQWCPLVLIQLNWTTELPSHQFALLCTTVDYIVCIIYSISKGAPFYHRQFSAGNHSNRIILGLLVLFV